MKKLIIAAWLLAMLFGMGCSAKNAPTSISTDINPPAREDVTQGTTLPHVERDTDTSEPNEKAPSSQGQSDAPYFYFSYDDSSSTAAHDLSTFYIEKGLTPELDWGRTYEYLNAERFPHFTSATMGPFEVSMGMVRAEQTLLPGSSGDTMSLGVNVSGPKLTKEQRPNVVATFLVDVSGSMRTPYAPQTRSDLVSLLDVAKHGLTRMTHALKKGDVINLVTFSSSAESVLEAWEFDELNTSGFISLVESLETNRSTNLHEGIQLAYRVAQRTYDSEKSNRVIILTDAYANTGEVSPTIIAENTVINGLEGIHFAGVGIGNTFDERFLNELTDIGKGTYVAMITPEDAERIFVSNFTSFVDSAVSGVRFKLEYPSTLKHRVTESAAEEVSTNETRVQTTNFAYNTQQFFLEQFTQLGALDHGEFRLSVTYVEDNGMEVVQSLNFAIEEIVNRGGDSILSANMAHVLAGLISGKLSCGQLFASGIYQLDVEHPIYLKYRALTEQFCAL